MSFLAFFNNFWDFNILLTFMGFYLLFAICFGTHFASCDNFDKPVLIQSFNYFSLFFLMLLFWLFCFDFICNDKLYLFNQMIQLIFIVCSICVLACSRDFLLAKKFFKYEYDILLFFVFFSAIALCFSTEFLLIYLTIELQSLAFYVFATFCRNSEFSTEAGLKYFVFGGLISCFLLLGLSLIYLYFGSLSFELIFSIINFNHDSLFFSGFLFVLCVFLFKLGSTPFHFWLPDVYEGSILSVTMLFACLPKIVLFGVFFKLCFFVFFDFNDTWSNLIGISAILSIGVGSISAIFQKRIKRLFAFSTIAHTGFMLLAFLSCCLDSTQALIFYIIVYSCLSITLFGVLTSVSLNTKIQPRFLINFSGLAFKNYSFAFSFSLLIFAIAGIPPLAGFFSKFFILLALIGLKYYFASFLVLFFSSIACFYYIRLIKIIFFIKNSKNFLWLTNKSKQHTHPVIGFFLLIISCFFLHPNLFSDLSIFMGLIMF